MNAMGSDLDGSESPSRILVIEDDANMRRSLDIALRAQGHEVSAVDCGKDGLRQLADEGADLVILDINLPDGDGRDFLRELRAWSQVPVLVLSVRSSEKDKVIALDNGANDYVTKPFGVEELMARVRGLLRLPRADKEAAHVYDDGALKVDLSRRLVLVDGEPVQLTRKEYALLTVLIRHAGRVVPQKQLLRELWGPSYEQDSHYLRVLTAKLRQKLGDDAASPRWIATEPRVGLRFLAGS